MNCLRFVYFILDFNNTFVLFHKLQDSANEKLDVDINNVSLLPRETRNSLFFMNKNTLLGTVIQYNAEKMVEDEVTTNADKVFE